MGNKLNILIIDSDQRDVARITRELTAQGFDFDWHRVEDLSALRTSLEFSIPDLVLAEADTPGAQGFLALEVVRETAPRLPFIFVTRRSEPGLVIEVFENGGNGHVSKQHLSELKDVIDLALASCTLSELSDEHPLPQADLDRQQETPHLPRWDAPGVRPVCPRCHRVDDGHGSWEPLAVHLRQYRRITVMLGHCPDCH